MKSLMLSITVVMLLGCAEPDTEALVSTLKESLKASKNMIVSLEQARDAKIILSAPYAIKGSEKELILSIGSELTEKISRKSSSDSGFHLFVVEKEKLSYYEIWENPPVVFSGYFLCDITSDSEQLEVIVKDSVLVKIIVR